MQAAALDAGIFRPLTVTERNWLTAFWIVVGSGALFWGLWWLERGAGPVSREQAFVYHPIETPMRFVGLAHFLVAILFMTTSRAMARPSSWLWLAGLLALGYGLCRAFSAAGGVSEAVPRALFFTYFLLHEFRDQAYFYEANGDLPAGPERARVKRDVLFVPLLALGLIFAVFLAGAGLRLGGARRYTDTLLGWAPDAFVPVLGLLPIALLALAVRLWRRRIERRYEGGLRAFLRTHRPMLFVYGGILAVLALDLLINRRAYAIVTLHVAAWYVFVLAGFARRTAPTPAPAPMTWRWMRSTRAGFNTLHLGLLGLVVAAALVWAYGFRNDAALGAMNVVLSKDAFPYWTIMHVTVSWIPR
jgi:hypothetical protein